MNICKHTHFFHFVELSCVIQIGSSSQSISNRKIKWIFFFTSFAWYFHGIFDTWTKMLIQCFSFWKKSLRERLCSKQNNIGITHSSCGIDIKLKFCICQYICLLFQNPFTQALLQSGEIHEGNPQKSQKFMKEIPTTL